MFRNLPLLLAAIAVVLLIGGVARILFAPRRPRRGGFIASLPNARVSPASRAESQADYNRRTNYGHF